MNEQYKKAFEDILRNQEGIVDPVAQELERTRLTLEVRGSAILEKFQEECAPLDARAREQFAEIILPWRQALHESGAEQKFVKQLVEKDKSGINLEDQYEYAFPDRVINAYFLAEKHNQKPFFNEAKRVQYSQRSPLNKMKGEEGQNEAFLLKRLFGPDTWRSFFKLDLPDNTDSFEFQLLTYPDDQPPYWSMSDRPRRILYPIDPNQSETFLRHISKYVHPGSVIHFAETITSGQIWENLTRQLA